MYQAAFKTTLYCLLFFCCTVAALGQQNALHSQITDQAGHPIPFATIGIARQNFGAIAFEDGTFTLPLNNNYLNDTLTVSAIGYKPLRIAYRQLQANRPATIALQAHVVQLQEVTVVPEQVRYKTLGVSKKRSVNNFTIDAPLKGASVAMLVNEAGLPLLIDQVAVTVGKANLDSFQLRCRFFDVDASTGHPGKDLLGTNLLATSQANDDRITFLLNEHFVIDQPFFVSFEWVMTRQQYNRLQQVQAAYPLHFIDSIITQYPGYRHNINEGRRILFRDSTNAVVQQVKFTKPQLQQYQASQQAAPRLKFKIKMKGSNTYYGSPITGRWSRLSHEALIAVRVGVLTEGGAAQAADLPGQTFQVLGREVPVKAFDDFLTQAMQQAQVPGLALAIVHQGQVVYQTVKGVTDAATQQPVVPATLFEGASLSKPLFAYMVMYYANQGLIDLDVPLHTYLPYADIAHDPRYKAITARMVLNHTTGMPNWRTDYPDKQLFLSFSPGSAYQYSGEGYQYLAKVLAHLLGTDDAGLEAAFQKNIARPLGMQHTRFVQDAHNLSHKAEPHAQGQKVEGKYANGPFGAAYSVHSEAGDFALWLNDLLTQQLLPPAGYAALLADEVALQPQGQQPNYEQPAAWTLGFARYQLEGVNYYAHGGNNYGYTSAFVIEPTTQSGIIVFTNANQASAFIQDVFYYLHDYE